MLFYVGMAIKITSCGLLKLGGHKIKELLMLSMLKFGVLMGCYIQVISITFVTTLQLYSQSKLHVMCIFSLCKYK
jgi:hypothetical protein